MHTIQVGPKATMRPRIDLPSFDALARLYQQDPLAFDAFRRQILEDAVAAAPARHRRSLHHTLDRIQIVQDEASTPLEAATGAFRLMTESWGRMQDAWRLLQYEMAGLQTVIVLDRLKSPSHQEMRANPLPSK